MHQLQLNIFRQLFQSNQDNRRSSKKNNSNNYCLHTVVPPDDGPRYARNM